MISIADSSGVAKEEGGTDLGPAEKERERENRTIEVRKARRRME